MSVLSGQEIARLGLLENADPNLMQTQGWDVRVDKVYRIVDKPYGKKITEKDYEEATRFEVIPTGDMFYIIPQNSSVLFKLMETVNLSPKYEDKIQLIRDPREGVIVNEEHLISRIFNALVLPKSSLTRRGVSVHSAWWDAGYRGSGVVLVRTSEVPLEIRPGDAFGQMIFFEGGNTDKYYSGQYQNEGTIMA